MQALASSPATITAAVAILGMLFAVAKLIIAIGKLVSVVEKVPAEMDGIREELRMASANTLLCIQNHGERIAVVEAMLNLDDNAQAKAGPRIIRRRGRDRE